MKRASQAHVNSRIDSLERKIELLAALEKRVALALVDILPTRQARITEEVPGYDIVPVKQGRRIKWVWKHFVRNSRSSMQFDTREECLRSARRNALEQLAYGKPSKDIGRILAEAQLIDRRTSEGRDVSHRAIHRARSDGRAETH